ncbi:peptide-methionine (S)-S-oxide reductase MsrA [Methylobacterium sp. J-090]|uniref:peptide-methionine (S)-S-oxide reductase MsrA n=1 Tax=Methylobacterium sp. J-090 TaxID=2836666 RepID=UPI001FB8FC74|nr:peptide-methionine (S)-S-oxide reductase MsrA [Methylobacterium sp. J-090]MCJ2082029.1 peptide-methionine (S)-S-oxide reductase MsrA [Methylobacterium sp. J-090]
MSQVNKPATVPPHRTRRNAALVGGVLTLLGFGLAMTIERAGAEEASRRLPAAATPSHEPARLQSAVFAGGCFWGVQGVFQNIRGVSEAVSGYAGGDGTRATYEAVSSGRTRHAEAVRVTYDPRVVSYDTLLRVFFSVALDPTQVDRQGPDHGPQYRSALFPANAEQGSVARAYIAQLDAAKVYGAPVATRIEPGAAFYPAEAYHQDFMARHPAHPYIVANDAAKVRDLKRFFPEFTAPAPVLVGRDPA